MWLTGGSSGTSASCDGTGVVSSGGTGVLSLVRLVGTGVVSSWFLLCLAFSRGESKVWSDVVSNYSKQNKRSM